MERRRHHRQARSFPLRFGDGEAEHDGLTRDLSAGGLFIGTRVTYPPGKRLWLTLFIEPQRPLMFEVVVVRPRGQAPARSRESGFGVRFIAPSEVLAKYFPVAEAAELGHEQLTFETKEAFDAACARGLGQGGAFVWSTAGRAVGDRLKLTLTLGYSSETLELFARVAQVVDDGRRQGLVLTLEDPAEVLARQGDVGGPGA